MAQELQVGLDTTGAGGFVEAARDTASSLSQFDYDLPKERIAQTPCTPRDRARLLVLDRKRGSLTHQHIFDLPDLLSHRDLLVCNDTKVLAARLYGTRERTGGKWEGLFLSAQPNGHWEVLSQTRGTLLAGETIRVQPPTPQPDRLTLQLVEKRPDGSWLANAGLPYLDALKRFGHIPLPPYIRKGVDTPEDQERYQTVFARVPGAVAAPTAGLHFTPELLSRLKARGIRQAALTLHVGTGTFQPIQVEDLASHNMHREWGELPEPTVAAIRQCKEGGGRVVAVGTTSVRVLESVAALGPLHPWSGETDLFIRPPFRFRVVDALLTNFHLPKSSLLVLVSAFAGLDAIRSAYQTAIAQAYRFYSYGDAMLIL